jgi:acyl-CoA thioesterase FadM
LVPFDKELVRKLRHALGVKNLHIENHLNTKSVTRSLKVDYLRDVIYERSQSTRHYIEKLELLKLLLKNSKRRARKKLLRVM